MNVFVELLKEFCIDCKLLLFVFGSSGGGCCWLWIVIIVVVLLVVVVVVFLFGCVLVEEVEMVFVVVIQQGSVSSLVFDVSGYVVVCCMVMVLVKIIGKVCEVMIEEGMWVEVGQVMVMFDLIDVDVQCSLYVLQLQVVCSQVVGLEVQQRQVVVEVSCLQVLVGQQLVLCLQYDQVVVQCDSLCVQLDIVQCNVKVVNDQLVIVDLGVDNNIVCVLFFGVVIVKVVQFGEIVLLLLVGGGFICIGIGIIVDMDLLEIEVEVGEVFIGCVQLKMLVEVMFNVYLEWKIFGEVIVIIFIVDRGKVMVKVCVVLKVKDLCIVLEMGVWVSFLEQVQLQVVVKLQGVCVLGGVVVQCEGVLVVFVLGDGNCVQQCMVEVGQVMGKDCQIFKGVSVGEMVVVNLLDILCDGVKV